MDVTFDPPAQIKVLFGPPTNLACGKGMEHIVKLWPHILHPLHQSSQFIEETLHSEPIQPP